jgi:hypothetical protein
MKPYLRVAAVVLVLLLSAGVNAYAKKPEVTRYDAQYLDRAVKINIQWQSTEPVVSIKVAAGREVKEIKVDPYSNRRNPGGYAGEEDVVLQSEPVPSQEAIPYSIQLEDEDGQRSRLVTGTVRIPIAVAKQEDQWGKERLSTGTSSSGQPQGDMIDKLRQVAQVLAGPPVVHDLVVNNPGSGTVTFKTKVTHSIGLSGVSFRIFDSSNKQIADQQIEAKGTIWQGTSKDFSLPNGSYFVIVQATDAGGSTSKESKKEFTITGSSVTSLPVQEPASPSAEMPATTTETPVPASPPPATTTETPVPVSPAPPPAPGAATPGT